MRTWPLASRIRRLRLSWLNADGTAVELTQATWRNYVFAMWGTQPWVIHAHDDEIMLDDAASLLFAKYDLRRCGFIERLGLARLLQDARLERLRDLGCDCSDALVERFVEHEFGRLDTDGSGRIELEEFTRRGPPLDLIGSP